MNNDKIAVIIPVYNIRLFLERCINSVLLQTYSDYDVYLIDDGSTDGSAEICDYYKDKSNFFVIHQDNKGLSGARNSGIDRALPKKIYKWITFLDSDDWIDQRFLEILVDASKKIENKVIVSSYTREITGASIQENFDPIQLSADDFLVNYNTNATIACGKLYDTKLFESVRYPEGRIHEDEFVTYKVLDASKFITFVNIPLYFYYYNPNSIMNSKWKTNKLDSIIAFEEQIQYYKKKGNNRMVSFCVHKYQTGLAFQYLGAERSDLPTTQKIQIMKKLKRKLRKSVIRNSKITKKSLSNAWIFEIAFPFFMKRIYWPYQRLSKTFAKSDGNSTK